MLWFARAARRPGRRGDQPASLAPEDRSPGLKPGDLARRARDHDTRSRIAESMLDGDCDRLGTRIGSHGRGAARLVHRLVRRRDHAGCRSPSPRGSGSRTPRTARVHERVRLPVEAREVVVATNPSLTILGWSSSGWRPQRSEPARRSRRSSRSSSLNAATSAPRFLRGSRSPRQEVRPVVVAAITLRPEAGVDARIRDVDSLRRHAEQLLRLSPVKAVDEDRIAASRVAVLGGVHCRVVPEPTRGSGSGPGRGPSLPGRPLRRIHPVRVVENVDRPREPLDRGPAQTPSRLGPEVREGEEPDSSFTSRPANAAGIAFSPGGLSG